MFQATCSSLQVINKKQSTPIQISRKENSKKSVFRVENIHWKREKKATALFYTQKKTGLKKEGKNGKA